MSQDEFEHEEYFYHIGPFPCDNCDYKCDIWEARACCELCRWFGVDYDCRECLSWRDDV